MRMATAKYEALYTLGGRSFSIWSSRRHAGVRQRRPTSNASRRPPYPANFNAGHENNTLDDRSDNKGPEPEGIAVGENGDRTLRVHRPGAYRRHHDVRRHLRRNFRRCSSTTPTIATSAWRRRPPAAGDLRPEGVKFIPAHESPTRRPMLAVAHEIQRHRDFVRGARQGVVQLLRARIRRAAFKDEAAFRVRALHVDVGAGGEILRCQPTSNHNRYLCCSLSFTPPPPPPPHHSFPWTTRLCCPFYLLPITVFRIAVGGAGRRHGRSGHKAQCRAFMAREAASTGLEQVAPAGSLP